MERQHFQQFKANNERAFTTYFNRHGRALIFYANSIVSDMETAEEIVQDAYMKLWATRERIVNEAHIKSFLYTVTRNTCIDHLRKHDNGLQYIVTDIDISEPDADVLARMIHAETLQLVYKEVKKLSPTQQRVFKMTFLEGLSTEEICARLDMTPNAVFISKSKALSTLKRVFQKKEILLYLMFLKLFVY